MDLNLVVLAGRLAAPPETRDLASGKPFTRYLVTVGSERPRRRVDVLPVNLWDDPAVAPTAAPDVGRRIWVVGALQRRFWDASAGRRSRLEIVAHHVELRGDSTEASPMAG